jgi:intracellular septation protein
MQLFYEILPVFLFFMAFKWYGIYVATKVGMVATFLQVIATRLWTGKWDRMQLFTLAVFVFFGSMTLYFHNPIFVKWKPTIIFWVFALIILGSHLFTHKPVIQRLIERSLNAEKNEHIPASAWRTLSICWTVFFVLLGGVNLYVAYCLSNDAWVNFKFYGITSAVLIFSILQAFYLTRFLNTEK